MKYQVFLTIILAGLMLFPGRGTQAEIVTTTDGRMIELNKDGTYKLLNKPSEKEYRAVNMDDLDADAENWVEKKVKLTGYIKVYGSRGDSGLFGKTLSGIINFGVDLKSIPRGIKRRLLNKCKLQCRVDLTGTFLKDGPLDYKIKVDNVIFP